MADVLTELIHFLLFFLITKSLSCTYESDEHEQLVNIQCVKFPVVIPT